MSNESYNNNGNWRSKLEALEALPGETVIDKNASWEKLHGRLRTKKSDRRRIIWYCSAAACLLLVLMMPVINSDKKDHEAAKNETVRKQAVIKPSPTILSTKINSAQITSAAPFEGRQGLTAPNKSLKNYHIIAPAEETKIIRLTAAVSNTVTIKETVSPPLKPLDTSSNVAAAVSVNKKLKVVHINELGDPVEESPGIARSADIHSFQLKLASQEVYINSSLASRTSGFTILKLKTSPN